MNSRSLASPLRSWHLRGGFLSLPVIGYLLATPGPAGAQQQITLTQAIQMAQEQGLQARAARASLESARHDRASFTSSLLPQLSLRANLPRYNRSIIPVIQPDGSTQFRPLSQMTTDLALTMSQQVPLTGGSFFVSSSLERFTVTGQQNVKTWSSTPVEVGLRQDIFRPNTARWTQRQQNVQIELSERLYLESMEEIAIRTTHAVFDVYSAQSGLTNAVTNAAVNDTLYTLNKGRYEVGRIGENDLLQSELALLRARASVQSAQLRYDRALAALRLAINLPNSTPIQVVVTSDVPSVVADTNRAVAEALKNRAAVSDLELQDVTAKRRVVEARLGQGIGATVQASFGLNSSAPEFGLAYEDLLQSRAFSLAIEMPLWQWGSRSQSVQAARSDQDRVASNAEATMRQTAHEAHFAVLELDQARTNLLITAKADTVAGKRFEVAYNRYVIGRIAIDNLYLAQSEKDQARNEFVQALRGYWAAYYGLRRATLFDFVTGQQIH
jgi:outer membrane protein TolC